MGATLRIVAEAVPFCFGPAATLLTVTQRLAGHGADITYLATGTAAQLIRLSHADATIVPCNTISRADVARHRHLLQTADLVVSNTNPDFAQWTIEWGCRTAVIDTLFWMWQHLDDRLAACRPYIIQDFVGIAEQKARFPAFAAAPVVGPLVSMQSKPVPLGAREDFLLVSVGGVTCPFVSDSPQYPDIIMPPLIEVLRAHSKTRRILVCGGGALVARLSERGYGSTVDFACLSHDQHLDALRRCRAAFLSPGLTGFFESLAAGTPVFFLPPQNYSQILQLRRYRALGLAAHGLAWDDLGWGRDIGPYLPEEPAVNRNRIQESLAAFCSHAYAQAMFSSRLRAFLKDGMPPPALTVADAARQRFDRNGPEQACGAILAAIAASDGRSAL